MLTPDLLRDKFVAGLAYDEYVQSGTAEQRANWSRRRELVTLTGEQRDLLASFSRRVHMVVVSGIWCGDSAAQGPMLAAIERATAERLAVRFIERDEHRDLADLVTVGGASRVPTVIACDEDFHPLRYLGDRSLARLRASAATAGGGYAPATSLADTLADWVAFAEWAELFCRLNPRLRERHGD